MRIIFIFSLVLGLALSTSSTHPLTIVFGTESGETTVEGEWTYATTLPLGRSDLCALSFQGEIWTLGGSDSIGNGDNTTNVLARVDIYNADSDNWRLDSVMTTARYRFAAAAFDDFVAVAGGRSGDDSVLASAEYYVNGTWIPLPDMLTPRSDHGAAAVGGRFYVFGGYSQDYEILDSVEFFEFRLWQWFTAAPLQLARGDLAAVELDNLVYLVGGFGTNWTLLPQVEVYDYFNDRSFFTGNINHARSDVAIAVVSGKYVVISGGEDVDQDFHSIALRDTEVLDVASGQWYHAAPLPGAGRFRMAGATLNSLFYAVGGHSPLLLPLNEVHRFDLTAVDDPPASAAVRVDGHSGLFFF